MQSVDKCVEENKKADDYRLLEPPSGLTYGAGTQGGEASHTLTLEEMPQHSHPYAELPDGGETYSWGWGSHHRTNVYMNTEVVAGTAGSNNPVTQQGSAHTTQNRGASKSHNNMPPYLAVYMWRRTA